MTHSSARSAGFSLLEVLIAMLLLTIGLTALAALQTRTALVAIEAYQRTQGLLLARDIAARILANKPAAARYVGDDYGTGPIAPCSPMPGVDRDICEWANALRGASEQRAGSAVGTLTAGRGCIVRGADNQLRVAVVWQGIVATTPPSIDCGRNAYGDDGLRRAIVLPVDLAELSG